MVVKDVKKSYVVYVKERQGNLRIAKSKKSFISFPEAEGYFNELVLDNLKTNGDGTLIIELQMFDLDGQCRTLKEKHIQEELL